MLRRDRQLRVQVNQLIDGGVFALGLWLAWVIRYYWTYFGPIGAEAIFGTKGVEIIFGTKEVASIFGSHGVDKIARFPEYFWLFLVVIPLTPVVLEWQGFYERLVFSLVKQMVWQLARTCTICAVGLILIDFMWRQYPAPARSVFVLFGFSSFGLMFLKEEMVRVAYKTKLGQAQYKRRIILVGALEDIRRLQIDIGKWKEDLEVVGEFDLNSRPMEELVASLHELSINAVVIAARHTFFDRVEKAIRACELEGIETWLLADFFDTQISETSLDHFYGRPVLVFRCGTENSWPRLIKQIVDFVGALAILVVSSPFMLAAAIAIKATSRGPVLFKQERAGLNGKPFVMYKFRSMVTNAEQLKQEVERLNEMSGPVFKVTHDPRVTKVGRLLRKFSLDEFPQLFNVLRFEMSLVGPRPLPLDEVRRFDEVSHRRRLSVRPGLTCIWQVSGRNDVKDFNDWVRMDLEYIDNWSLWLDTKILWRTIWVVLLGKGGR
jgi:exopolysaccharide biosynthesis polyprenyl glycosylphosphotransferase